MLLLRYKGISFLKTQNVSLSFFCLFFSLLENVEQIKFSIFVVGSLILALTTNYRVVLSALKPYIHQSSNELFVTMGTVLCGFAFAFWLIWASFNDPDVFDYRLQ